MTLPTAVFYYKDSCPYCRKWKSEIIFDLREHAHWIEVHPIVNSGEHVNRFINFCVERFGNRLKTPAIWIEPDTDKEAVFYTDENVPPEESAMVVKEKLSKVLNMIRKDVALDWDDVINLEFDEGVPTMFERTPHGSNPMNTAKIAEEEISE